MRMIVYCLYGWSEAIVRRFIFCNPVFINQGRPDKVQTFDERLLGDRVDIERNDGISDRNGLGWKVHRRLRSRPRRNENGVVLVSDLAEQETAIRCILPKDVAVSGRIGSAASDYGFVASLLNGPDGMLSRRSAAEIRANYHDRRARRIRLIQDEFRSSHVVEQKLTVSASIHTSEESGRDDAVCIDVIAWNHRDFAGIGGKCVHNLSLA